MIALIVFAVIALLVPFAWRQSRAFGETSRDD